MSKMHGSTSIDYRLLRWRQSLDLVQMRLDEIRDRHALEKLRQSRCTDWNITRQQYAEGLERWRYMRFLLTKARDQQRKAEETDKLAADLAEILTLSESRRADRAELSVARQVEDELSGLRARFPARSAWID